jgi:hypothetical protein
MTPQEMIDELTYINYRHNRELSPQISVERWAAIYGPKSEYMETRYQRERSVSSPLPNLSPCDRFNLGIPGKWE